MVGELSVIENLLIDVVNCVVGFYESFTSMLQCTDE